MLQRTDSSVLALLEQACFSLPWSEAQYLSAFEQKAFAGIGLWEGATLLAYVTIYHVSGEMEILNVATDPCRRREGFAQRLLQSLLKTAKNKAVETIFLEVRPSNTAAIQLYEKLGFTQQGTRRAYYPDTGEDALIYTHCPQGLPSLMAKH